MRVSLLKPPIGGILGLEMITFVEPLGLECVAGSLEERGHACQIVDLRVDGLERGLAKLRASDPALVGIQCNFTTERLRAVRLARRVRRELPAAVIVIGGHDASRDPRWFSDPAIDAVAVGDGEEILARLADVLDAGGGPARMETVPGLMLRRPSGPHFTGLPPARADLDGLPLPARHLIAEYADEYYISFRRPLALLETARGCPFKCNFCSVWKFHESTFREKSPARVVEELRQIRAPNVFITDDIFWLNARRGYELAAALKASGIRKHYTIQTRTDIVCKFPQLIEAWKDCGRMTVFLGLESLDDAGLGSINKSNSAANNDQAIEILQDLGVGYTPNFIVDPRWERHDFDQLKRWMDRTGAYNSGFSVLTPLPGTDLWDEVRDEITTDDWELFDIAHAVLPTRLPLDEFYREVAGLWAHTVTVRHRVHGRWRTHLDLLAALALGKVTIGALRKGLRMGRVLSRADSFLRAHRESDARMAEWRATLPAAPAAEVATG